MIINAAPAMIAVSCYTDIRFAAVGDGVAGGAITGLIYKTFYGS